MSDTAQRVGARAVIRYQGRYLLLRESAADGTQIGKYQIPGGMVEPGEKFIDALLREVKEETGLQVSPVKPIMVDDWFPTIGGQPHQIIGIFYLCEAESDEVSLSHEHDDYVWIAPNEIDKFETPLQVPKLFKSLANG